jgi:hypothetical protein
MVLDSISKGSFSYLFVFFFHFSFNLFFLTCLSRHTSCEVDSRLIYFEKGMWYLSLMSSVLSSDSNNYFDLLLKYSRLKIVNRKKKKNSFHNIVRNETQDLQVEVQFSPQKVLFFFLFFCFFYTCTIQVNPRGNPDLSKSSIIYFVVKRPLTWGGPLYEVAKAEVTCHSSKLWYGKTPLLNYHWASSISLTFSVIHCQLWRSITLYVQKISIRHKTTKQNDKSTGVLWGSE